MARAAGLPPPPLLVKVAASVGFLADAYDLFVINIVTTILRSVYPGARAWSESLVKSAIMVGTIAGQLGFGAAGDRVGRRASFLGSMMVCIAFSLLSGLGVRAVGGRDMSVFVMLAAFRLALGVGIGGEYPLSATITAEAASASVSPNGKSRALATVFSMQGVGNCAAPLLALALLRSRVPLDTVWRVVLACGALPFVLTAPLRWRLSDGLEYAAARKHLRPVREWARDVLVTHGRALLGTAGSWFLFDVVFYGNGLFAADFVELLGPSEAAHTRAGLTRTALASLFVSLLGLPGYWASIACIGDSLRTQRAIQAGGFGACALVYGGMARWFEQIRARPALFVCVYGASFFFSNFGPNCTTFTLPACYYPARHRAVCHGLSAAAGKAGALVAAAAFRPLVDDLGPAPVFAMCAVVSALGLAVTLAFVPTAPYAPRAGSLEALTEPLAALGADDGELSAAEVAEAAAAEARRGSGEEEAWRELSREEQEARALLELREAVADAQPPPFMPLDDACLLRYLRARGHNVAAAAAALRETLAWRRASGADEVLSRMAEVREEAATGKTFVAPIRDRAGRPVLLMRPAAENSSEPRRQLLHLVYQMERCVALLARPAGGGERGGAGGGSGEDGAEGKWLLLIDFGGYSMQNAMPLSVAREALNILQAHYPERLSRAVLFNAPRLFSATFYAVTPFIDPVTRDKIAFVSTASAADMEWLDEVVDLGLLEPSLGGRRAEPLFDGEAYFDPRLDPLVSAARAAGMGHLVELATADSNAHSAAAPAPAADRAAAAAPAGAPGAPPSAATSSSSYA